MVLLWLRYEFGSRRFYINGTSLAQGAPPTQAPSSKIRTKNQGLGARFLNGRGCGMNDLALEGHMIYLNVLRIEGHRNVRSIFHIGTLLFFERVGS